MPRGEKGVPDTLDPLPTPAPRPQPPVANALIPNTGLLATLYVQISENREVLLLTEECLRSWFQEFGPTTVLCVDASGQSGAVQFRDPRDAWIAYTTLNGHVSCPSTRETFRVWFPAGKAVQVEQWISQLT